MLQRIRSIRSWTRMWPWKLHGRAIGYFGELPTCLCQCVRLATASCLRAKCRFRCKRCNLYSTVITHTPRLCTSANPFLSFLLRPVRTHFRLDSITCAFLEGHRFILQKKIRNHCYLNCAFDTGCGSCANVLVLSCPKSFRRFLIPRIYQPLYKRSRTQPNKVICFLKE